MATIVTKNSSTASAVPTTSDLVQGELAVNLADKRLFTEDASSQIIELGTNPSTITTATATVTGTLTANGTFASSNAVITGGSINSTPIGATTPSTIVGSTITANTGFVGGLTGNVTGNLTGNVTGNVTGDLTGDVTGNLTAGSGTTTLNNLVVNGTVDFNAAVLSDLGSPVVSTDAATKGYVDTAVSNVIDAAPAALDTLNELAAALGDDANFSSTVTTALATKLPLAGGTMTGAIAMGTSKITGLGNPTAAQDAATKTYVDTADALKLNLTGGTMSGAIAMGTNKITGVGDPTLAQDAATKAYTDSILGSATSAADSAAAAATSASNAATSASDAATSATASANSATAAAASYDAFDDRYLGDKASDPTLDNDGNALLTGALYFNTTSDDMKVYNGSSWQVTAINPADPTFTGTVTADGLSVDGVTTIKIPTGGNTVEAFNVYSTDGATNNAQIRVWLGANEYSTAGRGLRLDAGRDDGADGIATFYAVDQAEHSDYEAIKILTDGGVTFSYLGSTKLATTATGIDVTGTVTSDDKIFIESGNPYIAINDTDITDLNTMIRTQSGVGYINTINDAYDTVAKRLGIDHATGDISFYEDTGTTPKFFWDASAESLGIGTTSPVSGSGTNSVSIYNTTPYLYLQNPTSGTTASDGFSLTIFGSDAYINNRENGNMRFYNNGAERMRIDSSGKVGIGLSDPSAKLHIEASNLGSRFHNTTGKSLTSFDAINSSPDAWNSINNTTMLATSSNNALAVLLSGQLNNRRAAIQVGHSSSGFASYLGSLSLNPLGGFVGIGTNVPEEKLEIEDGNIKLTNAVSNESRIYFTHTTDANRRAYIGALETTGNGNSLIFAPNASGSDGSEAMRIDSSGNVGIGTTSPTEKLDVSGTVKATSYTETVYALSGTALDPANGGIQTKTLAANTTFTDSLASGESIVLQLEAGASYTVTWPTITWVTSGGNVAPTLTAKDTLVFWKVSSTLYGAYTGSYV